MDLNLIKMLESFIAQGGAVAIAGLLVFFYRKDLLHQRDFTKETIDRLMKVVTDNTQALESLKQHLERVNVCPVFETELGEAFLRRQQSEREGFAADSHRARKP